MSTNEVDKLLRVLDDLLEYDGDVRLWNGKPFTGIGYDEYPNGQLEYENNYRDGLPVGLQREWFPNGQIKKEVHAISGLGSSKVTIWHANSQIQLNIGYLLGNRFTYERISSCRRSGLSFYFFDAPL